MVTGITKNGITWMEVQHTRFEMHDLKESSIVALLWQAFILLWAVRDPIMLVIVLFPTFLFVLFPLLAFLPLLRQFPVRIGVSRTGVHFSYVLDSLKAPPQSFVYWSAVETIDEEYGHLVKRTGATIDLCYLTLDEFRFLISGHHRYLKERQQGARLHETNREETFQRIIHGKATVPGTLAIRMYPSSHICLPGSLVIIGIVFLLLLTLDRSPSSWWEIHLTLLLGACVLFPIHHFFTWVMVRTVHVDGKKIRIEGFPQGGRHDRMLKEIAWEDVGLVRLELGKMIPHPWFLVLAVVGKDNRKISFKRSRCRNQGFQRLFLAVKECANYHRIRIERNDPGWV